MLQNAICRFEAVGICCNMYKFQIDEYAMSPVVLPDRGVHPLPRTDAAPSMQGIGLAAKKHIGIIEKCLLTPMDSVGIILLLRRVLSSIILCLYF